MQRLEAKNPPERPLFTAETRNAQNRQQDPRRNGLFSIDDGFYGSGRLNGGANLDRTACSPLSHRTGLCARQDFGAPKRKLGTYISLARPPVQMGTSTAITRDVGDHAFLKCNLLNLARHLTQVHQYAI